MELYLHFLQPAHTTVYHTGMQQASMMLWPATPFGLLVGTADYCRGARYPYKGPAGLRTGLFLTPSSLQAWKP